MWINGWVAWNYQLPGVDTAQRYYVYFVIDIRQVLQLQKLIFHDNYVALNHQDIQI